MNKHEQYKRLPRLSDARMVIIQSRTSTNNVGGGGFEASSATIDDGGRVFIGGDAPPLYGGATMVLLDVGVVAQVVAAHLAYCVFGCAACRPGEWSESWSAE
jgi:hypothetical protein